MHKNRGKVSDDGWTYNDGSHFKPTATSQDNNNDYISLATLDLVSTESKEQNCKPEIDTLSVLIGKPLQGVLTEKWKSVRENLITSDSTTKEKDKVQQWISFIIWALN